MKIRRNEKCPCGSGVKYKNCCLGKPDNPDYINPEKFKVNFDIAVRKKMIKQCLHPLKEECSEKIVKAHSLQNNRILNALAVNGHVITMQHSAAFFMDGKETGRKVATTFSGFCGYHDKKIFQPIEDRVFFATEEQLFLYAYRAFAIELHKKMEQTKMFQHSFSLKPSIVNSKDEHMLYFQNLNIALDENASIKAKFDNGILNQEYGVLSHYIWELSEPIDFAVSTTFEIEYDLEGKQINDYRSPEPLKKIFITIFTEEGKSYFIFSWLKENGDDYKRLSYQFDKLSSIEKKKYLNNLLVTYTENLVMSPRLWNRWGKDKQEDYLAYFHMSSMLPNFSNEPSDLLSDTFFDLFERASS